MTRFRHLGPPQPALLESCGIYSPTMVYFPFAEPTSNCFRYAVTRCPISALPPSADQNSHCGKSAGYLLLYTDQAHSRISHRGEILTSVNYQFYLMSVCDK